MHILLFLCSLLLSIATFATPSTEPHVILCTYYTESHAELVNNWLLPSIQDKDIELIIGSGEQHCPSATYLHSGWTKTTKNKVDFIIKVIKKNMGSIVIFADADIIFFRPIKDEIVSFLETKEFVVQIDSPGKLCSGFFALRANEKTLELWKSVRKYMQESTLSDQDSLNHFVNPSKNKLNIAWDFLPTTYFGGRTFKVQLWQPGRRVIIPENPAMFHANGARYIHKIAMLAYVKKTVEKRASNRPFATKALKCQHLRRQKAFAASCPVCLPQQT